MAALTLSTATAAEVEFAPRVDRWGVPEITLRSSKSYSNPFTEVRLRGRFYCRDIRVEAEGFYDGDQTWKVRLMPTHQGRWLFETVSNDPELNGQKGEFDAVSPGPGNHGPVVVRNQYHFAFGDGAGYFPLGTTLYNWVQRESSLQERTLAALKRSPFNKVRFSCSQNGIRSTGSSHRSIPTGEPRMKGLIWSGSIPSSFATSSGGFATCRRSRSKPT